MKITPEQLKAVCWALSGTTLCMAGDNHFAFYVGPRAYVTDSDAGAAIFCDLLKRAVLAQKDVFGVSVRTDKSGQTFIEFDAVAESWQWQLIAVDRSDELQAWVLAIEELAGRLGK